MIWHENVQRSRCHGFFYGSLRLIVVRTRFRASDVGQVAEINVVRAKSKQASRAEMVLGSLFFRSCDSAVRFWDSESWSQRRLVLCPVPRRVHFARPWTQVSKPTLTDSSLAAKRRADALHVVFVQQIIRAQHDELLLCVLSYKGRS